MATKGATKTIKVRITAKQTVSYDQIVRMTRAEYEALRNLITGDASDDDVALAVEDWIDHGQVVDAESLTDVDAEEVK
jgi:hypothetical protein